MSKKTMPLMAASVLGIIGLMTLSVNGWVGAIIVLIALAVPGYMLAQKSGEVRQLPPVEMVVPNAKADEQKMQSFLGEAPSVHRGKIKALMAILQKAGLDPYASVVLGADDQPVLTVKDLLAEMVLVANTEAAYEALQMSICLIHPNIFTNIVPALEKFSELNQIKKYLARQAMKDAEMPTNELE